MRPPTLVLALCLSLLGVIAVGACHAAWNDDDEAATLLAVAHLEPASGSDVAGWVRFEEVDAGVRVMAEVTGLDPGLHGFHVHEHGDCSAPDASSAGDHHAPRGSPHGAPADAASERHMGDLGNLVAGPDGRARYERIDQVLRLTGPLSIVGSAVIVHAEEDDLHSQPSGAAGERLACGVIRLVR